ncbi:MAG TPA: hypothetical protein RMH99_31340 [Sandaracinaceae bacterium LLY-WYZ-13_1]|nr:hypothetical protein [Sandaracinaceae bacterium LLY-WYZ-13_1]
MSEEAPEATGGLAGWKKALLVVLATAPIGVIAFSLFFMARYESDFDEARCPFEATETRPVRDGLSVREDRRVCQPGIEERRWVVLREGFAPLELGRRPLDEAAYESYEWSATEEHGRVRIEIDNPGHDPRVFREPALDSGLR